MTLYDLTLADLTEWVRKRDLPVYRARQIFEGLYRQKSSHPEKILTIPAPLREQLVQEFPTPEIEPVEERLSEDGTRKWLWKLSDGQVVESVMIPAGSRRTLCVSTQVGCAYACAFCASGLSGLKRNLTAGEIVQEVLAVDRLLHPKRVSNIVFMGMGEPLANYDNLLKAIRILNAPEGLAIGARKITISTVGLVPKIEQLSKEGLQLELAISLHAPSDELRSQIMPVNRKYSLRELIRACWKYVRATKRLLTFEYILIDQVNDEPAHAHQLAVLLKGLPAKVNLIPCHPIPGIPFARPAKERMLAFQRALRSKGITCTLRRSRGLDIEGACGQLRLRHQEEAGAVR